MKLKDLLVHEKRCPMITIKCPYSTCGSIVKLKDLNAHFLKAPHSTFNFGFSTAPFTFTISRTDSLNPTEWIMLCVSADDELFHVHLGISPRQKCYALSVWGSPAGAAKYRANLSIKNDEKDMCMNGLDITSVENVPSIDQCMDENGKCFWCIPFTLAENFSIKKSIGLISRLGVDCDVKRKC